MFDIPPLGYSIYTAKRANTSKCGVVECMDRLIEGYRDEEGGWGGSQFWQPLRERGME